MGDDLRYLGKYIKLVFVFYIVLLAVDMAMSVGLRYFAIEEPTNTVERNGFIVEIVSSYTLGTFIMLLSAVFEEALFRLIPFCIAVMIFRSNKAIVLSAILSCVLFGLMHGGGIFQYMTAIVGVVLYLEVYVAWKVEGDAAKACIVSAMSHFLHNMTVLIIVYWL